MDDTIAFAEELEEVALQLSTLDPLVEDPADIADLAERIVAEYERLGMTAAMFDKQGIQQVAEWIHGILTSFQATLPEAILELLQEGQLFNWIELTAIALREPEELSHLPAISSELLSEAWPESIPAELLQQLLINLRTDALHAQQDEDEAAHATDDGTSDAGANPLAWDADIHPELLEAWLQETPGQIAEAARLIHVIAKGNSTSEQKRHAARLAHTIKGASGVVGVEAITAFTHRLEDILDLNISGYLNQGLGDTLGACADCLESLFEHLQEGKTVPDEYATLLADMDAWEQRITTEPAPTLYDEEASESPDELGNDLLTENTIVLPEFITQAGIGNGELVEEDAPTADIPRSSSTHLAVPMETVQRLLNLAGELITSTSQIAENAQRTLQFGKQLQQQDEHIRQMLDELSETIDQQSTKLNRQNNLKLVKPSDRASDFDHLELEGYNDLYSTTNLLTESVADSREMTYSLQQQIRQISDQVYQQQRLQRQLSETILRTRLIPVQSIAARVERTVRETCRRTNKQANIKIIGQNLQVDTDILQGLTAPLLHMLRNAVDHGIEMPEQRQAQQKPVEGVIELRFEQKGNHIHMTLSDDGQGLDVERIRRRATERDLLKEGQDLSEAEMLRLILQPGFTTREQVSDISGRGVGMDVVQSAVEDLQGLLHLSSQAGKGTSVHIQVPLTLIATNALLVRTVGNLIAIPGNTIQQVLYVASTDNISEDGTWYIEHQNQKLEVLQLARLFGWYSEAPDLTQGHSLLIIASENKTYAVHVDDILQPRDIVVKNLPTWLNTAQGVSGACILANGEVAPVLDTLRLLRNLEHGLLKSTQTAQTKSDKAPARQAILIVDDSLSNRKSLSLMVEQLGYRSITAVDGLDALQHLHSQAVELILTDLEMPRMNGLEMTQAVRIWPEKRHVPIIMVTSRSTQKHREMAQQAGVDGYLTKPVDHETLKTQLQKWLSTQLAA